MIKTFYTIFNILVLTAIIYTGVDAFYRVLEVQLQKMNIDSVSVSREPFYEQKKISRLEDFQTIIKRNLFSTVEEPETTPEPVMVEKLEPTSLRIKLIGTIAGVKKDAAAFIEETGKRTQGIYREGDSIQNAVVKTIMRGKVILRVGDKDEVLEMAEPATSGSSQNISSRAEIPTRVANEGSSRPSSISQRTERTITVSRSDINDATTDINNLLSQASIRPHFTDGEADGLAITGIRAGSIFRRMGLRNGDIVQGVNEEKISNPDDLISLYNDLTSESELSLQIRRRGQERTINYRFRD